MADKFDPIRAGKGAFPLMAMKCQEGSGRVVITSMEMPPPSLQHTLCHCFLEMQIYPNEGPPMHLSKSRPWLPKQADASTQTIP